MTMKKDPEKNKMNASDNEVKAPADTDESVVEEKIDAEPSNAEEVSTAKENSDGELSIEKAEAEGNDADAQPAVNEAEAEQKKKDAQKKRRIYAFTAAGIVLAGIICVALVTYFMNKHTFVELPGGLSVMQFSSKGEINRTLKDIRKKNKTLGLTNFLKNAGEVVEKLLGESKNMSNDASGTKGSSAASGEGAAKTDKNTQVSTADEADIIKTDGKYIYCVDNNDYPNSIAIFKPDGVNTAKAAEITPAEANTPTLEEAVESGMELEDMVSAYLQETANIDDIYINGNKLIAICDDIYYYGDREENINSSTKAFVYDISNINKITLLDCMTQSGSYKSSRMIGDTLYTVSDYQTAEQDYVPVCGEGTEPESIPFNNIYSLHKADTDRFTVISAFDTVNADAEIGSTAILGDIDDIYCNEDNMYIYSTVWDYDQAITSFFNLFDENAAKTGGSDIKSRILKADLSDGITLTAYTEINGYINDQYSLDEKDGDLRVVTTSSENWNDTNNLFVLDEKLGMKGSVSGLANNSLIKGVRYLDDVAYVTTYEQTDPLFVVDLRNPVAPKKLKDVKISGFSSMLVPIDDKTMLGLGFHDETKLLEGELGLKLVLYDISDKTSPKILDGKSYVKYESAVMTNPKALVFNPDRKDFILPLNNADYGEWIQDAQTGDYSYVTNNACFGGMLNFRVDNGKIVETEQYVADFDAVDRCVYVGDYIYMTYYTNDGLSIISEMYK